MLSMVSMLWLPCFILKRQLHWHIWGYLCPNTVHRKYSQVSTLIMRCHAGYFYAGYPQKFVELMRFCKTLMINPGDHPSSGGTSVDIWSRQRSGWSTSIRNKARRKAYIYIDSFVWSQEDTKRVFVVLVVVVVVVVIIVLFLQTPRV